MTEALHPEHLQVGDTVGSWRILSVLGQGGSARVFKVERDGRIRSMKMMLRPVSDSEEGISDDEQAQEANTWRRLAREAAALFTYSSHPNLLRVYAVDFWPNPSKGYPFLITDYVDGDTWHEWRWRKLPHAAELVDTFAQLVSTVGELHQRGVYHRDLKAENVLIRRKDGRPFLIDFGTVRLPGALTKTLGLPEGVLHLLPPELIAYTRTEAWKRNEPFQGGAAADLYALGVLLYQGLTDKHPFDPELPDEALVAAIATVPPDAPHRINPRVPRALSDIALRLLEKRPEARYPDTQALLQALWAAAKERHSPVWRVPLTPPNEDPAGATLEEKQERIALHQEAEPEAVQIRHPEDAKPREEAEKAAPPAERRPRRSKRLFAPLAGLGILCLIGLLRGQAAFVASTPKGSASMPSSTTHEDSTTPTQGAPLWGLFVTWLCATTGLGCTSAQVKPEPGACPEEARHAMYEELKINPMGLGYVDVVIDIHQPGPIFNSGHGTYGDGPLLSRVLYSKFSDPVIPEGTLLYGHLWTTGFQDDFGSPAVYGRYTQALLPDGRKFPVCFVLSLRGTWPWGEGSKPGAVVLPRVLRIQAVKRWP
ncbi:serine/threonine protein kinase [Archangium violaceum]|uniref:serine/threonine protein kinase n=1 Tax=Archangium violaceum TaxID=83451 RepID=UPI00194EBFA5|nr:serine/threonine-protein kinase [Archangium violaceum]QRN97540.1 serine/threonine protein kinase [Archangium violaceum]